MKVLPNGRTVRFSKRTDCRCVFSCSVCNQTATSLGVSRTAVPNVMTSSTEKNSGRKPKLIERNRHTLNRMVSKNQRTAAAKVTAELVSILKTPFPQKQSDQSFTNPISTVELQLLNLRLLSTALKGETDHKTRTSDDCKYVIWSDDHPPRCLPQQAERPRKPIILNAWFQL